MTKPYSVHHLELDGKTTSRDDAYPNVHFELHPMGTELPEDQQVHELVIIINESGHREARTRVSSDDVSTLIKFLGGLVVVVRQRP